MKLSLDNSPANTIIAYATGVVRIHCRDTGDPARAAGTARVLEIRNNLIVTPEQIIESWLEQEQDELSPEHMQAVLALDPEIIILGTGSRLQFPANSVIEQCHAAGVGVEVMDTGAACRTYNILAGEGRRVAAALLMIR